MNTVSKGIVKIVVQAMRDEFRKELTCLTVPTIADSIPSETFPRDSINVPANIKLADPDFHVPRAVDLLIGAGTTVALFSIGQINLSRQGHDLYLQKTRLGWVVAGGVPSRGTPKNMCHVSNLEERLSKFWEYEEFPAQAPKSGLETECELHFVKNTTRADDGRYVVRLPFRRTELRLGESRTTALRRLSALERKLDADTTLKREYTRVIEEYLDLNHMSVVENPGEEGYYMPHHAVIKNSSNTTKVRVVFDASAKTSTGASLNDILLTGPTIQDKLVSHLLRFRTYTYVITADIEKMYRQGVTTARERRTIQSSHGGVLSAHLYVDDLLSGAGTVSEARSIRDDLIALLKKGGFSIRQWAANDERIINDLEANAIHSNLILDADRSLKTLGIVWNAKDDKIHYSAQPIETTGKWTKRSILSEIVKIYDPIGLLGSIILYAKKYMQDIWRCGLNWDESVPQDLHTSWLEFVLQLSSMERISFDRRLLVDDYYEVQWHGFCDASEHGYGASLYIRSRGRGEKTSVRLLCSRSRVAPLKPITIPRLELCGALLLARLYRETFDTIKIAADKTIFWCDSTIVLHWLKSSPHRLKTFVANRVAKIQELTNNCEWRHVVSEDNPADALSRGQLPQTFARNQIWFSGPTWLAKNSNEWPETVMPTIEIPELKKNTCLVLTIDEFDAIKRYSSYSKLTRVIAYCLRFSPRNKRSGPLLTDEIRTSELRILKIVQGERFSDVIGNLKRTGSANRSKVANLNPFLDVDGLIRVGGRLQNSNLSDSQKHPILLPSRHHLTDIIIRETHKKYFYAGIQTTLCLIRQRFWLLDGRNQVRRIVRACTRCFRFNANTINYKMGNLSLARVREATPFAHTGVDFCGPFFIKERKYRNRNRIKVYVSVFVCMAIKAIHLEVVNDLTTEGFIAALRRFSARRGLPNHIFSDNGTNFVGANNQLKELYAAFNSDDHKNAINEFARQHRITWHFIPPAAPHFGGLWEAAVKIFKHHFKRVVGDSLFTFEEFNTFVIEIEGVLNSRPITSVSSDPNDLLVLTPAHCLIGKPLTTLPEGDLSSIPANRLSTWQHIPKVRQDFWARWSLEYLNELQTRTKWAKDGPKVEVGAVVLVKDKGLPCTSWMMGRITRLYPGDDGIARAATIKTANGEMKRAINRICLLPIEEQSCAPVSSHAKCEQTATHCRQIRNTANMQVGA